MFKKKPSPAGAALLDFSQNLLDQYASAYADTAGDPVNKSRLQAVLEIRNALPSTLGGGFKSAKKKLIKAVEKCQQNHVPMFDTEYGSGRPVFKSFLLEIEALVSVDDCALTRFDS